MIVMKRPRYGKTRTLSISVDATTDKILREEADAHFGGNVSKLVAAIELVSPGNKDRGAKRDMFLAKCLDNIAGGACVVVVDVITARRANLHNELVATLGAENLALPEETSLYAATYRPIIRKKKMNVDVWVNPLRVGEPIPTMPLRIVAGLFVPVELEETYAAACRGRKLSV